MPVYNLFHIRHTTVAQLKRIFIRKIFNKNTLKLSYGCIPNVKQIIDDFVLSQISLVPPRVRLFK